MNRIALLGLAILVLIGVAACGAPPPADTQAPAASTQPAVATQAPVESTQLAVSTNETRVDITLADNTIESSLTTFQAGVPYTFVIANTGHRAHNFNISTPVSIAGSLEAALSSALLSVDQNQLGTGASLTVEYTFPDSAAGAQLEFSCLIRRHYDSGIYFPIAVTK